MTDKPAKSALLIETAARRGDGPDARVHPHQARRRQGREAACIMRACRPRRSTATSRRTSASACSARSAPASSRRWSRPTSRRAASTSTASATSSITTCRTFRKATCTASAAPRAPAPKASRSRSATTRRRAFLRDIEKLIQIKLDVDRPPRNPHARRAGARQASPAAAECRTQWPQQGGQRRNGQPQRRNGGGTASSSRNEQGNQGQQPRRNGQNRSAPAGRRRKRAGQYRDGRLHAAAANRAGRTRR